MTHPTETEFDPVKLIKMMANNGHNALIGALYHAHGDGWCELAIPYDARLASDATTGIMASGPILTMMDMVTSMSIWLKTGKFQPQATLDLRVDYLRPATPGRGPDRRGYPASTPAHPTAPASRHLPGHRHARRRTPG